MAEDSILLHDFWAHYPDADAVPAFRALRTKRGEEASSRIMWYLRFMNDPEHEYISKLPKKDREELLKKYCHMTAADFKSALYKEAESWYKNNYMSKAKQVFMMFGEKMEQAKEAISTGEIFAPTDIAVYRDALKALKEFTLEYEAAESMFKQEMKAAKAAKMFGKDTYISPADSGSVFD